MKSVIPTILHVEDLANDRMLVALAFERAGLPIDVRWVPNSESALEYLRSSGISANPEQQPFPSLVLLDLKLDYKSGFDVLTWIRGQPHLKHLPVVILSSSDLPDDRERALQGGASGYFCKPMSLTPLQAMLQEINARWLT